MKIFADGADLASIREMAEHPAVEGFTTNPSLMRKAGVTDYKAFAKEAIAAVGYRPISFEVFADDYATMYVQAREIASWGSNVYVKIPVMNSVGETTAPLISALSSGGVKVNVTAVMTEQQVKVASEAIWKSPAIISIFAGRIADSGKNPCFMVTSAFYTPPNIEFLWASPREMFNIKQAAQALYDIITLPPDMIKRMDQFGRDLTEYSRETVATFRRDAIASGFTI